MNVAYVIKSPHSIKARFQAYYLQLYGFSAEIFSIRYYVYHFLPILNKMYKLSLRNFRILLICTKTDNSICENCTSEMGAVKKIKVIDKKHINQKYQFNNTKNLIHPLLYKKY